jgi:hypothetical protein
MIEYKSSMDSLGVHQISVKRLRNAGES